MDGMEIKMGRRYGWSGAYRWEWLWQIWIGMGNMA